ncbi:IS66-like element accessory protein TnpA [Paracraurococcus lichenis]|uniref:Transposase n=1 Tax=Paracraurococcus lichenis TaxID=3064888 RepID=A0ABT9E8S5_9PROT|nr:transposase [Paracraurococcus sp. LOR1-02]MDO9712607.1 transposase [Paracraurococcus sp. LOR1-02]
MEVEAEARSTQTTARTSTRSEVVEVVTRGERRRIWSDEQKRLIVLEAMQPGALVTEVARRWGVGTGLIYTWRRQMRQGELGAMPVPAPAFAQVTIASPPAMAEPEPAAPVPEVPAEADGSDAGLIEVALPCGATVRVGRDVDEAALRRVLSAVRAR